MPIPTNHPVWVAVYRNDKTALTAMFTERPELASSPVSAQRPFHPAGLMASALLSVMGGIEIVVDTVDIGPDYFLPEQPTFRDRLYNASLAIKTFALAVAITPPMLAVLVANATIGGGALDGPASRLVHPGMTPLEYAFLCGKAEAILACLEVDADPEYTLTTAYRDAFQAAKLANSHQDILYVNPLNRVHCYISVSDGDKLLNSLGSYVVHRRHIPELLSLTVQMLELLQGLPSNARDDAHPDVDAASEHSTPNDSDSEDDGPVIIDATGETAESVQALMGSPSTTFGPAPFDAEHSNSRSTTQHSP